MKARIYTKESKRGVSIIIFLVLFTALGFGQGLLAEGAIKAFNSLKDHGPKDRPVFYYAKYSKLGNDFANASYENFEPVVVKSISVNSVEIVYEQELTSERWMTESFSDALETSDVESWMNEPFYKGFEPELEVEQWMSSPFYENNESPEEELTVESWMTVLFN